MLGTGRLGSSDKSNDSARADLPDDAIRKILTMKNRPCSDDMLQFETTDTLIATYKQKINSLFEQDTNPYRITSNKDLLARVWATICRRSFPTLKPFVYSHFRDGKETYDDLARQDRSTKTDADQILRRVPKECLNIILADIYYIVSRPYASDVRSDFITSQHAHLQLPFTATETPLKSWMKEAMAGHYAPSTTIDEFEMRDLQDSLDIVREKLLRFTGNYNNGMLATLEGMLLMVILNGSEAVANTILYRIYPKKLLCHHLFHTHKLLEELKACSEIHNRGPSPF